MAEFDLAGFLKALQDNPEALAQVRQQLDAPVDNPYTPVTPEAKVQHFTKLITHGMKEPKTYVHQAFPAWRYHVTKPGKIVKNAAEAAALGPEWQSMPFEEPAGVDEPNESEVVEAPARKRGRPAAVSQ